MLFDNSTVLNKCWWVIFIYVSYEGVYLRCLRILFKLIGIYWSCLGYWLWGWGTNKM